MGFFFTTSFLINPLLFIIKMMLITGSMQVNLSDSLTFLLHCVFFTPPISGAVRKSFPPLWHSRLQSARG